LAQKFPLQAPQSGCATLISLLPPAKRSNSLPEDTPIELAENLAVFSSDQAIADLSVYRLMEEEAYLFPKYYKSGESVLDLACGLGRTTLMLHEMGLKARGVDRAEVLINLAKRRLPYLDLRVGSYDKIEEPDASFSHVLISFNGIDYAFPAAQRTTALRECARVLKPGGTFIYSSHNLKSMHCFSPYYRGRLSWKLRNSSKAFRDGAYILEDGAHTFYASQELVRRQTEETGLKLIEMRWFRRLGIDGFDRYLSPYIHYVFSKPLG
jgi:ubiquinone/menaquinone biosynthesis C-methylase UbiE